MAHLLNRRVHLLQEWCLPAIGTRTSNALSVKSNATVREEQGEWGPVSEGQGFGGGRSPAKGRKRRGQGGGGRRQPCEGAASLKPWRGAVGGGGVRGGRAGQWRARRMGAAAALRRGGSGGVREAAGGGSPAKGRLPWSRDEERC
jgi:hypothetical protein